MHIEHIEYLLILLYNLGKKRKKMKISKYIILLGFMLIFNACGGGGSGSSQGNVEPENIVFYESENRDIDIMWKKNAKSYRALAIEDDSGYIKIFDSKESSSFKIVCRPVNPKDDIVTYSYTVYQNNNIIEVGNFDIHRSKGAYEFVMGSGSSFAKAKFISIGEKISANGLDINIKYGQYKLLDKHRSFAQYHGYFLLHENNKAKGIEFVNGKTRGEFSPIWKYSRNDKIFTLDNRVNNGGYGEGRVYGNGNNVNVKGKWSNGSSLDAKFEYINDSRTFTYDKTKNNKKVFYDNRENESMLFGY